MLNKKILWSTLVLGYLLLASNAYADALQDFVLTQLDGKGTVDSINPDAKIIVIDDLTYVLASDLTVFDTKNNKVSSIEKVKVGSNVGFKAQALSKPTAPHDQLITKIWILPSKN